MVTTTHIGPGIFDFFRDLAENNNRDWFNVNKSRYESEVKEPLLQFIRDFESRLHAITSHYVADARPVGGSLFRIYRDTRFSKDKTPYKTNAGVHFRHEAGKDAHAPPGIYLHFEPGSGFGGIWHPDSATVLRERYPNESFDVVFTSDTQRAYDTARLILGGRGIPVVQDGYSG